MPVVNKIKEFIENRRISPYRFAQEAGLSFNTAYALYNNPMQRIGAAALDRICDAYKIQPSEVIVWIDPDDLEQEGTKN